MLVISTVCQLLISVESRWWKVDGRDDVNIFNLRWLDAAASFFFEQLGIIEFFVINVGVIYTSTAMPHTCKSPVIMMQVLSNSFLNLKFSNHTLAEIVVSIDIFKILTLYLWYVCENPIK